jgi:hypothetical protein
MSQPDLDPRGEAYEALNLAVSTYGQRVLSHPRILANHVDDLLPDLPRERSLLVTAAKADVAGELTRHVEEFHLDPDTAVRLVARAFTERMSIDPAAGTWVTAEYARALGYPVRSSDQAPPAPAETAPRLVTPGAPSTVIPSLGPDEVPPPPPGPGGVPADESGSTPAPPWWRNRPVMAAIAVAAVVVVYFAIAAVVHTPPFTKPAHPQAGPTSSPTHPQTALPSASLPPGVAPLTQLLPSDLSDPETQCHAYTPPFHVPGLVRSLTCIDHGLPGGDIFAYQANSPANYQTALQNFNIHSPFYVSSAGSTCPPAGGKQAEGIAFWHDYYYPLRAGQIVECQWAGNKPTYIWTFPTEDAFIVAAGATTFSALGSWFTKNGLPLSSPSPAASS